MTFHIAFGVLLHVAALADPEVQYIEPFLLWLCPLCSDHRGDDSDANGYDNGEDNENDKDKGNDGANGKYNCGDTDDDDDDGDDEDDVAGTMAVRRAVWR